MENRMEWRMKKKTGSGNETAVLLYCLRDDDDDDDENNHGTAHTNNDHLLQRGWYKERHTVNDEEHEDWTEPTDQTPAQTAVPRW